jgi:hypothetical protein
MSRESLGSYCRDCREGWVARPMDPTAEGRLIVDFPGLCQALRNSSKMLQKMQTLPNNTKMFHNYTKVPPNGAKMLWT